MRMRNICSFILSVLTLAFPLGAQTVKDAVTLSADATDLTALVGDTECGMDYVQFFAGTTPISPRVAMPSSGTLYSYNWDTKSIVNGNYAITAKATDKAGMDGMCDGSAPNIGVSNVLNVVVNNTTDDTTPPTVTITITVTVSAPAKK